MRDWNDEVSQARQEFQTSREAENMLRELRKAAIYCTGPSSSVSHGQRISAVETVMNELREKGQ